MFKNNKELIKKIKNKKRSSKLNKLKIYKIKVNNQIYLEGLLKFTAILQMKPWEKSLNFKRKTTIYL